MTDPLMPGWHHLIPTWDYVEHHFGFDCACGAYPDMPGSIIHNAFDGREAYEPGGNRIKH